MFLFLLDESWFTQLISSTLHIHSYGVYIEKNKWYKSKRQLYHWLRLVKPHYNISLLICLSINAKSTYLSLKYVIIATKKPSLKRRDFKHPTKLDTLLILGWAKFYGSELARKLPSDDARTLLHRWAEPYGTKASLRAGKWRTTPILTDLT